MRFMLFLFFFLLCLSSIGCTQTTQKQQPNILWITIEDTSPQFIGSYGNEAVKTPVIDHLAREGVRFMEAFSNATVCSPSRSTIITGVSTQVLGTGNHRSNFPIPKYMKGFPSYLREAGYYTSNNKKKDYNTSNAKGITKASWEESSSKAGWWNREKGQPFFSVFNFNESHQSRTMTNPYAWYEEFILEELPENRITGSDEFNMLPFYNDTPEMRNNVARIYNSINRTDIEIGKLINRLKKDGLMDETIIFLFADHGEGMPRAKGNGVGLGYRVPFIIWFPDRYKYLSPWELGKPSNELISFIDLAPTVLSLAGVSIPDYMKGRPFLGEEREKPVPYVYGTRDRLDESPGLARTITDGRYVYTRNFNPQFPVVRFTKYVEVSDIMKTIRKDFKQGDLNKIQAELVVHNRPREYLFDLKNDPWEINNLAKSGDHQKVLEKMRTQLLKHLREIRDINFMPEYELRKISKNELPYEYRQDSLKYPFEKIMDTALMVGGDETVLQQQIELLDHENPIIRYWAAAGVSVQGEAAKDYKSKILAEMEDESPLVQIEMAGLAYRLYKNEEAKNLLEKYAVGNNLDLALQALTKIQYMDEDAEPFIPVLRRVIKKMENMKFGSSTRYHVQSSAEVTLHNLTGAPLYYEYMKKWIK